MVIKLIEALYICQIYHMHEVVYYLASHQSRLVVNISQNCLLTLCSFKWVSIRLVPPLGFDQLRKKVDKEVYDA